MAEQPQRAMVIMAHPDDAEFTVAGTVARWTRDGHEVIYVICTDGSRGSNDPNITPASLVAIRKAEQDAAARVLGVKEVVCLGYEDGTLVPTLSLRRDLTRIIRRYRPHIVVCPDPATRFYGNDYLNHPDHRAAGDAALDAVFPSAGTRHIFPELLAEGLEPHDVKEVYIHGHPVPNYWIDISDTVECKIAALEQHKSQVGGWEGLGEGIRAWAKEAGASQGMALAESFKRLVLG